MRSIPQVLLVAALLTIGACSRDVASPTPEALAVVDNALGPFESLGELHNAYLDFLAPRLKGSADKVQTIRSACGEQDSRCVRMLHRFRGRTGALEGGA